jgi:hypothetical protein
VNQQEVPVNVVRMAPSMFQQPLRKAAAQKRVATTVAVMVPRCSHTMLRIHHKQSTTPRHATLTVFADHPWVIEDT